MTNTAMGRPSLCLAILCFLSLSLSVGAEVGAELLGSAGFSPASDQGSALWSGEARVDGRKSLVLDDAWALKGSAALGAGWDAQGPWARAEADGAVSLLAAPLLFVLGMHGSAFVSEEEAGFPALGAELRAFLDIGESRAEAAFSWGRIEDEDGEAYDIGLETGFEGAIGILVARPGIGAAYRMRPSSDTAFLLKPGIGISLYPSIPAYADISGYWERDLGTQADELGASLHALWVAIPWLELSADLEYGYESGAHSVSGDVGCRLDLLRKEGIAMTLPVIFSWEGDGGMALSAGLAVELP